MPSCTFGKPLAKIKVPKLVALKPPQCLSCRTFLMFSAAAASQGR